MKLTGIMLGSEDSRKLAEFYTLVLGPPLPQWSDEASGWFAFDAGAGGVVVGPHSEVTGSNPEPGRIMVSFEAADLTAEFERIKALGATVVAEPYAPEGGGGMQLCTFADPDGNYFQLMPPMPA